MPACRPLWQRKNLIHCPGWLDHYRFVHASVLVEEWSPSITSEGHHRPDQLPEPGSGAYTELCKLGVGS